MTKIVDKFGPRERQLPNELAFNNFLNDFTQFCERDDDQGSKEWAKHFLQSIAQLAQEKPETVPPLIDVFSRTAYKFFSRHGKAPQKYAFLSSEVESYVKNNLVLQFLRELTHEFFSSNLTEQYEWAKQRWELYVRINQSLTIRYFVLEAAFEQLVPFHLKREKSLPISDKNQPNTPEIPPSAQLTLTDDNQVLFKDAHINLGTDEARLLKLLIAASPTGINKEVILEKLFPHKMTETNMKRRMESVYSVIHRLKKKLLTVGISPYALAGGKGRGFILDLSKLDEQSIEITTIGKMTIFPDGTITYDNKTTKLTSHRFFIFQTLLKHQKYGIAKKDLIAKIYQKTKSERGADTVHPDVKSSMWQLRQQLTSIGVPAGAFIWRRGQNIRFDISLISDASSTLEHASGIIPQEYQSVSNRLSE